jgi:hypothetical protein
MRLLVVPVLLLLGCSAEIPEDRFRCVAAAECPAEWYCVGGYCRASPGGIDAGTADASRDAASNDGPTVDAPIADAPIADAPVSDAPRPCAGPGDCNDGNDCTIDLCPAGFCTYAFDDDGSSCDDDMFCNGEDTCASGVCTHAGDPCAPPTVCDDVNDWCLCDDGNPCTGPDHVSPPATCAGNPLGPTTACGPPCSDSTCMVCCAGVCRDMRQRDYCAGCTPCSNGPSPPREDCVYAPARPCGWLFCCSPS